MAKALKKYVQSVKVPTRRNTSLSGLNCTQSSCKFEDETPWQPWLLLISKQRRQSLLNPTCDLSGPRGAEGQTECCREVRMFPGSQKMPKFLSGVFCFQETHWSEPYTRMVLLPGEHLRVRHIALIFPPSTISNDHREPSLCTSEKALQLAGLFETRGSTAVSQQPSKWPVPMPWLSILVKKKIDQHLWKHWLFHPQCRRHKNPTINKQH